MGSLTTPPPPSALQTLLRTHPAPSHVSQDLHSLALQIAHNLHFQHSWTNIRIHHPSSSSSSSSPPSSTSSSSSSSSPRPLLSGLPPRRLYAHPDEQIELLQRVRDAERGKGKAGNGAGGAGGAEEDGMPALAPEREWVLPSHVRERWSLGGFGAVFDGISRVAGEEEGEGVFGGRRRGGRSEETLGGGEEGGEEEGDGNAWRMRLPKRLVLATVEDDSTVVYYIVHDGVVKPRQN